MWPSFRLLTVGPSLAPLQQFLADIISVTAMTQGGGAAGDSTTGELAKTYDTLKYRLLGSQQAVDDWGHEYVRHLAMEIIERTQEEGTEAVESLLGLALDVANFFLDHNSEPDACDLLYEIGKLSALTELVLQKDKTRDYERVCLYLLSCVPYEADGDDRAALEVAHNIYLGAADYPHAIVIAMRLNDPGLVEADFCKCPDPLTRKQLAYILARQRLSLSPQTIKQLDDAETMENILNNTLLSDHFLALAKDLEILEPKTPEDIYKSHLQDSLRVAAAPSARHNLATSLVNALVNAGFGTDRLVTGAEVEAEESKSWIYKTKDHGLLSSVASIALLHLWNADTGLAQLDRYLYSENVNIRAGAILGIGLVHSGTKNESDPALALLREYLEDSAAGEGGDSSLSQAASIAAGAQPSPGATGPAQNNMHAAPAVKIAALIGLALAYGGTAREEVVEGVLALISHEDISIASFAALVVGHVFVGSRNGDYASMILQCMMERGAEQLDKPVARFLALSLALLYLGKTETEAEVILETLQAIEHPIAKDATTLVKICSYAGSGNVLRIQELLRLCTDLDQEAAKGDDSGSSPLTTGAGPEKNYQSFAAIGVALICMMEDVGKEISHRIFSHLMHYGSPSVRKAVPLALGLLYTSHPAPAVMDILSKYSHDHDKAVAVNATFAMGLIASGTNNAKMAQMLRQLAAYYQRDPDCLYIVRLAQGLVHMSKGTVSLSPIHSHRLLFNPAALAGLLTVIVAMTDAQNLLLENFSYLLYFLVPAMYPRFAVALNAEDLSTASVLMRVGQAVDVVGQAGKPKTITGFQTHTSPVLLAYQDRAEIATEEYLPLTPIIENFVLVRKNPHWVDEQAATAKK